MNFRCLPHEPSHLFVAAIHYWHNFEKKKLDNLIRKSVKMIFGIYMTASTEHLCNVVVHNTLEEINEAQEYAKLARIFCALAGRTILATPGINPAVLA